MEEIEKFELLGFHMKPISEEEFAAAIVDVVHSADEFDDDKSFNDAVLDLTERLTWTRQEIALREKHPDLLAKRRAQAKTPRTWCDAECTYHKFHDAGGTPIDYDGNPIPVDRPFPARLNDKEN